MIDILAKIKEEQKLAMLEYEEKLAKSIQPLGRTIFLKTQLTNDPFDRGVMFKFNILIIGNNEDQDFLKIIHQKNPDNYSKLYNNKIFQIDFECVASNVDTIESYLKVLKISKVKINFSERDLDNKNIISHLLSTKPTNLFSFKFKDFESFDDIVSNIIKKSATTLNDENLSNWRKLGQTQSSSFNQNFIEKDVLIHKSLIEQISKHLLTYWQKQNKTDSVKYIESQIQKEFLENSLNKQDPTQRKMKI